MITPNYDSPPAPLPTIPSKVRGRGLLATFASVAIAVWSSVASAQVQPLITTTKIPSALVTEIQKLLPESKPLPVAHPDWVAASVDPNLSLPNGGGIKLTFIDEGAGYKNSVGWFTYDQDGKVLTTSVAFANASEYGGGGSLLPGDTVDLGSFAAGTHVGFYLVADGYSRHQVLPAQSAPANVYYTLDALNPLKDRHMAMVVTQTKLADGSQPILLGFEDLSLKTGDRDFNDCVFLVQISPSALPAALKAANLPVSNVVSDRDGDGVDDAHDQFPDDPARAYKTVSPDASNFYFMAFEDLFPYVGDGDYNDFIGAFRITRVTDAKNRTVDLQATEFAVARGAQYHHEFHHRIRWTGGSTATSLLKRHAADGSVITSTSTQHVSGGADLVIFPDTFAALVDPTSPRMMANTEPTQSQVPGAWTEFTLTFATPLDATSLEALPFDPYIVVLDTGYDIHQVGKVEITGSKNPDTTIGKTFVDGKNYPFSMIVPSNWMYPEETIFIETAYPRFASFRSSQGALNTDWFASPAAKGVRKYTFAH